MNIPHQVLLQSGPVLPVLNSGVFNVLLIS